MAMVAGSNLHETTQFKSIFLMSICAAHEGVQAECIATCGMWLRSASKVPDVFMSMCGHTHKEYRANQYMCVFANVF
jgi:hypothetical protein